MDVRVRKPLDLSFVNSYAALPEGFHARVAPSPLAGTHLVSCSPAAAALLGLDAEAVRYPELSGWLSGRRPYPGAEPVAEAPAGGQRRTRRLQNLARRRRGPQHGLWPSIDCRRGGPYHPATSTGWPGS